MSLGDPSFQQVEPRLKFFNLLVSLSLGKTRHKLAIRSLSPNFPLNPPLQRSDNMHSGVPSIPPLSGPNLPFECWSLSPHFPPAHEGFLVTPIRKILNLPLRAIFVQFYSKVSFLIWPKYFPRTLSFFSNGVSSFQLPQSALLLILSF